LWQQIIIVEGITEIPDCTFSDCFKVKRVIFADTIVTIGESAFQNCKSLVYIKLSINLEVIVQHVFENCNLSSVFIPPRCQFIGKWAFLFNKNLKIFNVPQETDIDNWSVISRTKLLEESDFQIIRDNCDSFDSLCHGHQSEEIVDWIKNIKSNKEYSLHRACCSFQPLKETIMTIILQQGIGAFNIENEIGITPAQYLKENPYGDILEKDIIQEYMMKMMEECEKRKGIIFITILDFFL
jgi:hypothetical protein